MEGYTADMIEAMAQWVIKVTKKEMASAEEVAALGGVAKVVVDYQAGLLSDVK